MASESTENEDISTLRQEIEDLYKENRAYQHQLLATSHKRNDVTDAAIIGAFTGVFTGVESWIDDVVVDVASQAAFHQCLQRRIRERRADRFVDIGLETPPFADPIDWLSHLSNLPYAFYLVLSSIISRYLTRKLFRADESNDTGPPLPMGIDGPKAEFLIEIQSAMEKSGRDAVDISRWRSDAVSALLTLPEAREVLRSNSGRAQSELIGILEQWIGSLSGQLSDALWFKITSRATDLLDLMGRSCKRLIIGSPFEKGKNPGVEDRIPDCAKSWHARDIQSWRDVPAATMAGVLQDLYPGLLCLPESADDKLKILVEPKFVGYESKFRDWFLDSSRRVSNTTFATQKTEHRQPWEPPTRVLDHVPASACSKSPTEVNDSERASQHRNRPEFAHASSSRTLPSVDDLEHNGTAHERSKNRRRSETQVNRSHKPKQKNRDSSWSTKWGLRRKRRPDDEHSGG